jgi:hypothetical protein
MDAVRLRHAWSRQAHDACHTQHKGSSSGGSCDNQSSHAKSAML